MTFSMGPIKMLIQKEPNTFLQDLDTWKHNFREPLRFETPVLSLQLLDPQ